jgi:D-alanyl-D-alanine carboxypeptidase/D-alanyl-D-alanine-endopeptidase (penicillin-binding protein 4)
MLNFAALLLFSLTVHATNWPALLDQGMPADLTFGVELGGQEPFTRNADLMMAPASVAKLFTTGAILSQLPSDYRFATKLNWQQSSAGVASSVRIVGSGDPTWGMTEYGETLTSHLDLLASSLSNQGVREIDGDIQFVAADPRWQDIDFPVGWSAEDTAGCDGAIGQAFNLNANCAAFLLSDAKHGSWNTAGVDIPVELKIVTGPKIDLTAHLIRPTPQTYSFLIDGTWPLKSKPMSIRLPIHDTRPWLLTLFRQSLQSHGIRLVNAGPSQDGEPKELVFYSPTLATILQPFLKNSINVIGDDLLKTLGSLQVNSTSALRQVGLDSVKSFLLSAGFSNGYDVNDGSGLSRSTLATPHMLFEYLEYLKGTPAFPVIWDALAIAGVDGTLKARMHDGPALGELRGKTGTLDGVYNLAGYIPQGSDFVPFVILSKTIPMRGDVVRSALDLVAGQMTLVNVDKSTPLSYALWTPFAPKNPDVPFVKDHCSENHP